MSLAADLIRGLDPVALAFDLGLDLDPWQRDVLRGRGDTLVAGGRQVGKSTTAGVAALHAAMFTPDALVLLVAPAQRQSIELFRGAVRLYQAAGRPVPVEAENTMALALENGSRILALPGSESTLRGYGAVHTIIVDEAARVSDELYHSVYPMLATSGGRVIAISTPNGPSGWFYAAWRSEKWERHTVRSDECPRIPKAFLEERRREMPEAWYRREFEASFLDPEGASFRHEDIEAAFDEELVPWALT